MREGQIFNKIAFIYKGLFRIYHLKDGNEVNSCFCTESTITTSFNSFIQHSPSGDTIQALENSTIVTLSSDTLKNYTAKAASGKLPAECSPRKNAYAYLTGQVR